MIYIVGNTKGGSGKSFIGNHILPAYLYLRKGQEETLLYEFDEHSRTSQDYLQNSPSVKSQIIKEDQIQEEVFNVRFSSKTEDVIIDVGAGHLLGKIVKEAELAFKMDELVFVVPYSDDSLYSLQETIASIEKYVENPKIVIVINRLSIQDNTLESAKDVAIDLFGSKRYSIKPSSILKDIEKYVKSAISEVHILTVFARTEKVSMIDMYKNYLAVEGLDDDELENVWKARGAIKGEKATREEFVREYVLIQHHLEVKNFLDSLTEFYDSLDSFNTKKK